MKSRFLVALGSVLLVFILLVYISITAHELRLIALLALIPLVVVAYIIYQTNLAHSFIPIQAMTDTANMIVAQNKYIEFGASGHQDLLTLASSLNEMQHYYQSANQEVMEKLIEGEEMFIQMIFMMNAAVEAKDHYTSGHSSKVAEYTRSIVQEMGLNPELSEKITLAAVLHDVGKIGIKESILNKRDKLSDDEYDEIKYHALMGKDILSNSSALWDIIPCIYHHHEHYNGCGYPEGLAGDEIPLGARIISVADAYDAMTSDRPYRMAMPIERAVNILLSEKDKQFEGRIVDAFIRTLGYGGEYSQNLAAAQ
ncbi:MAG: HD-GYP domain-containing protein [Acidobacteriota bacterium]